MGGGGGVGGGEGGGGAIPLMLVSRTFTGNRPEKI